MQLSESSMQNLNLNSLLAVPCRHRHRGWTKVYFVRRSPSPSAIPPRILGATWHSAPLCASARRAAAANLRLRLAPVRCFSLHRTQDEAEKHVSELVVAKAIGAKIDRPAGVVRIGARKAAEDALNGWAGNISKLLDLVEKACQQISKEAMVAKVALGGAAAGPAAAAVPAAEAQ